MTLSERISLKEAYDKVLASEAPVVVVQSDDSVETDITPEAAEYISQIEQCEPVTVINTDIVTLADPMAIGIMLLPTEKQRSAFEDMAGVKLTNDRIRGIGQFVKDNAANNLSEEQIQEGIMKVVKECSDK